MRYVGYSLLVAVVGLIGQAVAADGCCGTTACNPEVDCQPKVCQPVQKTETKTSVRWCCKYVDICLPKPGKQCGTDSCASGGCTNGASCADGSCGRLVRKKHLLRIVETKKVPVTKCEPVPCPAGQGCAPAPQKQQAPPAPAVKSASWISVSPKSLLVRFARLFD